MGPLNSVHSDRSYPQAAQSEPVQASVGPEPATSTARRRATAPSDTFENKQARQNASERPELADAKRTGVPNNLGYFARLGQNITEWLQFGTKSLHQGLQWGTQFIHELRSFAVSLMSTLGAAIKDMGTSMMDMARNLSGPEGRP